MESFETIAELSKNAKKSVRTLRNEVLLYWDANVWIKIIKK